MGCRRRVVAGILAVMMAVFSLQLPGGTALAAESGASVSGNGLGQEEQADGDLAGTEDAAGEADNAENADDTDKGEDADHMGGIGNTGETAEAGGTEGTPADTGETAEAGETEGTPADTGETAEAGGTEGTPADPEVTPGGDKEDGGADSDSEEDAAAPDGEEAGSAQISGNDLQISSNSLQVSGNDLMETKEQPETVTDEMEGVYQFGGAPSAQRGRSLYSEAEYSEAKEYIYQRIKKGWQAGQAVINIDVSYYEIPADDETRKRLVSGMLNEHLDLYYVKKQYSYANSIDGTELAYLVFQYGDYDDAALQEAVKAARQVVDDSMTDLKKAIVLHDYLALNCAYDKASQVPDKSFTDESFTIYGVLVKHTAVSQGYALAYKYLLEQEGINCYMVTSSTMNYAWNLVELNGRYYHVDVTWDDPAWDRVGRVLHSYMLCSDSDVKVQDEQDGQHRHEDWSVTSGSDVIDLKADAAGYDSAFWKDCTSAIVFSGNDYYYTFYDASSKRCAIKKGSLSNVADAGVEVVKIDPWKRWKAGGTWEDGEIWEGVYSGLFQIEGRLYYNDMHFIRSIPLNGSDRGRIEFELTEKSKGFIYGITLRQGRVFYTLHKDPNENNTSKEEVLEAVLKGVTPTYTITYVLDGGVNDSANPYTYTAETDTVDLRDAVREGYRFDGWYSDSQFRNRVTQIAKGSTGDKALYAKWVPVPASEQTKIDTTPKPGNVLMGVSGAYYTESAEKILTRLNDIRWEACTQGVKNPKTGEPLTEKYYVPLKWSSDLEAIARLRAAEAAVNQTHERLNGDGCFSVHTASGEQSWAENLAWNYTGMMDGIEQWYSEKDDWVYETGKSAGHYKNIINPSYLSVAVGTFRLSSGGCYSVAQEFSYKGTLDEWKDVDQGECVQYMEVQGSKVSGLTFDKNTVASIEEGGTYQLSLDVSVTYHDYYDNEKSFSGPYQAGGSWSSSDEAVAVVDEKGMVSAMAEGTTTISMTVGSKSVSTDITVYGAGESPFQIIPPAVTTYKVGESIDVTGGKVSYQADGETETKDMTVEMLSGFSSAKPGICTVTVMYAGYTARFDTLIVEEPRLDASVGQALKNVSLPSNEYGTYAWQEGVDVEQKLEQVKEYTFAAVFTPKDEEQFQELKDLQVRVRAKGLLGDQVNIAFKNENSTFIYNGTRQEPEVVVSIADSVLTEGQDYELFYKNNKNVGKASAVVRGINCYSGMSEKAFVIQQAPLIIRAKNKVILIGDGIPAKTEYECEAIGIMTGDRLLKEPDYTCDIQSTETEGEYEIIPQNADAGKNYNILAYENGRLVVTSERITCEVVFDVQGHGMAPIGCSGIKAGSTIERPADPTALGYRLDGWYQDAACTKAWDFDTDIVQSNMTLYAKWLHVSESNGFAVQEIPDVSYTGKACKPAVSIYDGETLLKSGRDYQIRYYNNTNANRGGKQKTGSGEGESFNPELPYVEIVGKGHYADAAQGTLKVNFNILKASIGDEENNPSAGVKVKVSDQLVTANKKQKPFSSIKYGKAMKQGTDYTLSLITVNARDQQGESLPGKLELEDAVIPAGYEGEFLLKIKGRGNYTGRIEKTVYVADRLHLIKNAKITLGKKLKNVAFQDTPVVLTPAESNADNVFTVKCGNTFLTYEKDYEVSYRNNDRAGKAELIIKGTGEYAGEKTAVFNIKGKSFTAKKVKVDGIENKVYTGRSLTQNKVSLTYNDGKGAEKGLAYGTDYTISYAKNINKGTASMTFKGKEEAGFSGSFKKTFKITAADITKVTQAEGMKTLKYDYCKAGVKPVDDILLTNASGITLHNGKDYTLKYVNNKAVADVTAEKPPTVVIKGKGNYTGETKVYFRIDKADLGNGNITVKTTPVAYNSRKASGYAYKPAVKLMEGKTPLRAGTDYEIAYLKNTQADYNEYLRKLESQENVAVEDTPRAVITEHAGAAYKLEAPSIVVPLPIYQTKLVKKDLTVEIAPEESVYTGSQVTPSVKVYYGSGKALLEAGRDYTISYGSNNKSGKNKGSVTISGVAPKYGGDVTVKFDILRKPITY